MKEVFIIVVLGTYIYMSFISRIAKEGKYLFRVISAVLCLLFGVTLDYLYATNRQIGFYTLLSSLPITYLFYYELIRRIMRPWIGNYPYSAYRDKIGSKVMGIGYPKNRYVTKFDYIFTLLMLLIPILTFAILSIKIK